jgi:hypothetical protein
MESPMTTSFVLLACGLHLVILSVVVFLTRPTGRRLFGALAGGAACGLLVSMLIVLAEALGWWHLTGFRSTWPELVLFWCDGALGGMTLSLIVWRVVRRFGGRGVAVLLLVALVIGLPRAHLAAALYPDWFALGPGIAPVLAVTVALPLLGALAYVVMRLVAGSARADRLARRPWAVAS